MVYTGGPNSGLRNTQVDLQINQYIHVSKQIPRKQILVLASPSSLGRGTPVQDTVVVYLMKGKQDITYLLSLNITL